MTKLSYAHGSSLTPLTFETIGARFDATCRALITADRFKTSDYLGMLRKLAPEIEASTPGELVSARLPHLRILIHLGATDEPGFLTFDDVRRRGGPSEHTRLQELAMTLQSD